MGTPTVYRYRRPGDASWQWEPVVVADSWFFARKQAQRILECENPQVEDSGREPPLPEVVPPPAPRKRKRMKSKHKKRARKVKGFKSLRKKAKREAKRKR